MRAFLPLLLLLAAVPAGADDDKKAAREARAKEEARIQRRVALKTAFNAAEKPVAAKFEAFAFQPIITEILIRSFGEEWRAELESRLDFE